MKMSDTAVWGARLCKRC